MTGRLLAILFLVLILGSCAVTIRLKMISRKPIFLRDRTMKSILLIPLLFSAIGFAQAETPDWPARCEALRASLSGNPAMELAYSAAAPADNGGESWPLRLMGMDIGIPRADYGEPTVAEFSAAKLDGVTLGSRSRDVSIYLLVVDDPSLPAGDLLPELGRPAFMWELDEGARDEQAGLEAQHRALANHLFREPVASVELYSAAYGLTPASLECTHDSYQADARNAMLLALKLNSRARADAVHQAGAQVGYVLVAESRGRTTYSGALKPTADFPLAIVFSIRVKDSAAFPVAHLVAPAEHDSRPAWMKRVENELSD